MRARRRLNVGRARWHGRHEHRRLEIHLSQPVRFILYCGGDYSEMQKKLRAPNEPGQTSVSRGSRL